MAGLQLFHTYDDAENYWSENDQVEFRGVEDDLAFDVDCLKFVMTLEKLALFTGDQRFQAAVDALYERDIVSGYSWSKKTPVPFANGIEEAYRERAVALALLFNQNGLSLRLALANAAANLKWPGNSFSAAVKSLERLVRSSGALEE